MPNNQIIRIPFTFSAPSQQDVSSDNSSALQNNLHPELQRYLREEVIRCGEFDLSLWWQLNKTKFPTLHRIFLKYSFVPASSSAVESEFSYAGLIITNRRSKILPENVNDLMVARNNCFKSN